MLTTDSISKITTRILLKEPFYGHFLLGMPKYFDDTIDTACVSLYTKKVIKLRINPSFFMSLNQEQQYGLLKHEILHVVLQHLFQQSNFSNKSLYNVAADLVVNQFITPTQLPEGAIRLETFSYLKLLYDIELKPFGSTTYYYELLQKVLISESKIPIELYEKEHGEITKLSDLLSSDNTYQKQHYSWYEFDQLDKASVKVMEYQLFNSIKDIKSRILKNNLNSFGLLPSELIEYLTDFLNSYKSKIQWKSVLKKFATTSKSTYIQNTLRRPSKRYGTVPGIKVKKQSRLLIAIDTSSSVLIKEIEQFFGELHQIWKRGAEIIVVECDTVVQQTYEYKGKIPNLIHGRGGTNFTPIIQLANTKVKPDGIIYFTDGYALAPSVKSRCPILWLITENGISEESDFWGVLKGIKIKMISNE